jgi:hypothetical protein
MITVTTKLSVKELAPVLGRSIFYIYKARAAGLPMEWDQETRCFVQTPDKVKRWIKRSKFKIIDGRPVKVQNECKP